MIPSCRLHVEQEPQSPRPVIRKSTSWATLTSVVDGAGALALLLWASVRTVQHPIGSCTLPELKARAKIAYTQALPILLHA